MTEMRASVLVDLAGNLEREARKFQRALGQVGRQGARDLQRLERPLNRVQRGLSRFGRRAATAATAGLVVGGALALRNAMRIEERRERLGVQAKKSTAEMEALWTRINKAAGEVNLDPKQLLGAVEAIVERTGDLDFATANLGNLANALQATGAGGEAIGGIAAELQKMDIRGPAAVAEALDILNAQGKAGAFTLQNLAALGPRVFAAYAASGRGGMDAIREMGAALQMIRQGTGSSEQATTAFEALMRTLQDADKVKVLQEGGIQLFDPEALKRGEEVLRPVNALMGEIIRAAGGKGTVLSQIFDAEAMRAFNTALAEFRREGQLPSLEKFFGVQPAGDTAADARRVAATASQVTGGVGARITKLAEDGIVPAMKAGAAFVKDAMEGGIGAAFEHMGMRAQGADVRPGELRDTGRAAGTAVDVMSGRSAAPAQATQPAAVEAPTGRVVIEVQGPGRVREVRAQGLRLDVESGLMMQGGG